ncbi:transmembrane protein 71 isoform X1 [Lagopus muta]|uniref:transmembrane protein 71 isoform X1 n=1 Tax=Lagopus muta TaxID=64668 RepID=UPI00209E11E0|nr:transmembrane protein 71 isoform X1 [Lagopus muta]XP_048796289.1 transmembrane protein 71 isoform X1 [Lagopus muta]
MKTCQLGKLSVNMIMTLSYLASVGSTVLDGEHKHSLSEHIYQSYACTFLDDGTAHRCCSTSPSRGSLFTCRRSPRLLSNGYYILTEDSFLSDEDGNITLSPSQTSVTYKENSVRIFRRRKKMRGSLASLFSFSASSQWLSSTILNTMDSSHVDDPWLDKCSELQPSQTDTDNSDLSCEYNILVPQGQIPASIGASLTKDEEFIEPGKSLCASPSCSPFIINGNKDTLNKAESNSVPNFLAQIAALMVCLIISVCTRYFLGGFSAILLLIILAFLVSQDAALSSFFSLVTSFKTTNFEEALGASGRHSHLHCDKGTDCSTSQTTQHEVKVLCIAEDS